ncbi:hypothetical protein B1R32_11738 [Abditibacterium utsteinense]|uniref:Transposase of IS4/5 family (DUF4096) n=1 Tax=Abditibacterium utsteinense TaxID=1960156 RepID=A0A2S8SQD3_9BACT|nr:hypothetical protein B1R32_11738 [Abditibacterium utsteinense]
MPRRAKPVSPSDLSDSQWSRVAPVLRSAIGRSGSVPLEQEQVQTTDADIPLQILMKTDSYSDRL